MTLAISTVWSVYTSAMSDIAQKNGAQANSPSAATLAQALTCMRRRMRSASATVSAPQNAENRFIRKPTSPTGSHDQARPSSKYKG
jgi:hypothetical protein